MMTSPTTVDDAEPRRLAVLGAPPAFSESLHVGRPNIGNREHFLARVNEMLERRWFTNNGPLVLEFERGVADVIGVKHCIAMCNGTIALEIAIRALGLKGEVIMPSYTFVATAHALQWQEITPVFADIDPRTHNIDPASIERLITPRTTRHHRRSRLGAPLRYGGPRRDCRQASSQAPVRCRSCFRLLARRSHDRHLRELRNPELPRDEVPEQLRGRRGRDQRRFARLRDEAHAELRLRRVRPSHLRWNKRETHRDLRRDGPDVAGSHGPDRRDQQRQPRRVPAGALRPAGCNACWLGTTPKESNYQYVVAEVSPGAAPLTRDELVAVLHAENVLARKYFWPGCHRMEPYRSLQPNAALLLPETERLASRIMVLPTGQAVTPETVRTICGIVRSALAQPEAVRGALRAVRKAAD